MNIFKTILKKIIEFDDDSLPSGGLDNFGVMYQCEQDLKNMLANKVKLKQQKYCHLCHSDLKNYWDIFDDDQISRYSMEHFFKWKNKKIQLCSTCLYMIINKGLLAIPPVFDNGSLHGNEFGAYGRRFESRNELYKFMMKSDLFLNAYSKKLHKRLDPTRYPILSYEEYDKVAEDLKDFVQYKDIKNFLDEQFHKNNGICTNCENPIYTKEDFQKELRKIESDQNLNEVEKYGAKHEMYKTDFDSFQEPHYFIKSDDSGIAILHRNCITGAIIKKKIKPFHVALYYDHIDQITNLVK